METSPVQDICKNLIKYAIQRCRISENLCRLSIVLKPSPHADPPIVCISISDTGVGSSLTEFHDLNKQFCRGGGRIHVSAGKWDGMLSITTTDIHDKEIYHYHLSLGETFPTARLTQLTSTPKNGCKFSGTEVSLSTRERIDCCLAWMTCFCKKLLVLKSPNIAVELVMHHMNITDSNCETLLQVVEGVLPPSSMSSIDCMTSNLEDYALKHGNTLDKQCETCFSNKEHFKVGTGLVRETESLRSAGLIVEAVILIMKMPETSNTFCLRECSTKTEVMYFQDFSPSAIPFANLKALSSIDWHSYGLSLRDNIMDCSGNAVLEWEDLPPSTHIDIVLHSYHNKVVLSQPQQSVQSEKSLAKKAVKLALDDIKTKYAGLLLSNHALKIQKHAPHLSRAIAGLILSSNDLEFQGECASLLGLLPPDALEEGRLESCIMEKIDVIIEMNDRKPKRGREDSQYLFEEEKFCADGVLDEKEDNEGDDDAGSVWDL